MTVLESAETAAPSEIARLRELERRALEAEAAQKRISNTLDAIMASAPAVIIAVDEAGRITFINTLLPQHKREDVIGSDWLLYLPPAEHEVLRARLARVLSTGIAETYETTVAGPDASTLWFSTHMGPMRQDDRIIGAVLVARDVTSLKRAQAELTASQRLAAVGTLAAGVAHEINTPIQFVSDSVVFLSDAARDIFLLLDELQVVCRIAEAGGSPDELQAALDAVHEAEVTADLGYVRDNVPKAFARCLDGLQRVSSIVRSMKAFSHPDQASMVSSDINRAILDTLTIARNEYKYVATVETDLADLPLVICYISDINQVVLNLIMNAAQAIGAVVKDTETMGTITVRTRAEAEHVVISVSDTGTGIPEGIAHRVFEPFFTTKQVGEGTGQGLALAWSVVKEKHGGEIRFESKVGEGTTFFIRIPIAGRAGAPGKE